MGNLIVLLALAILAVPVLLIVLWAQTSTLRDRVARLERELGTLRGPVATPAAAPGTASAASPAPAPRPPVLPPLPAPAPRSSRPSLFALGSRLLHHWFTVGNVPVKVGMLVLFAGVAALLKYAADQGWMQLPVELKLAAVALVALCGLAFGWHQRTRRRSFALALQGGAIGILLLVVFAAFKLIAPPLLPAAAAFGLSIALVTACGVLAVRQDAPALAVLSILAGFLAPLWLSTGSGNHVVLFGYYALLDAAVVAIAWFRAWRALNLLAFFFTFAIGIAWGVLRYRPDQFESTEPFLLLFFALFSAVPILFARRRAAGRRDFVDGCLLFGTPLVAFSLQAGLLEGEHRALAWCALGLATIYAALAWLLRQRPHFRPLVAPYVLLACGFATLAAPLALSAQATASVFALEGACAVWLGLRQQQRLPQLAGVLLQLLAAAQFADGAPYAAETPVLNAGCALALLIALAGFGSAWSYRNAAAGRRWPALPYYLWGLGWWLWMIGSQIDAFADAVSAPRAWLLSLAGTALLAAESFRLLRARTLAITVVLALASALLLAPGFKGQPLSGPNLWTWIAYALLGWRAVAALREDAGTELRFAHLAWWGSLALVASIGLHLAAETAQLGEGWRWGAAGLPWWLLAAATLLRPDWVRQPAGRRFDDWRRGQGDFLLLICVAIALSGLQSAGSAAPWRWVPLFNPLELLQASTLALLAWRLFREGAATPSSSEVSLLAAAALAFVTMAVLRCTHHWGDVAWDATMFGNGLVQTALSVTWSVFGVIGWIVGSRRGLRGVWLGGALLMAVVLAKLVLVDRDHLGNLLGIASFLAYGLLCTAVGYFAPVPPQRQVAAA